MKPSTISNGIPALAAVVGVGLLAFLLTTDLRIRGIRERPLNEGEVTGAQAAVTPRPTGGTSLTNTSTTAAGATTGASASALTSGGGTAAANLTGEWLGFRGASRDNLYTEKTPLAHQWGATCPRLLWQIDVGEGYASAAVSKGRVFVLDYDQANQQDALRCLSLADGKEIWRRSYPDSVKRNHGMSRTVPAIQGNFVVTLGPRCMVMCCDATTGQVKWQHDLVSEFGTTVPEWYAGQCPLIDGNRVIIAPSGKALMVAFDLATGKPVWQAPNPMGWQMTHSSIAPMTFGGQRVYVYCGSGGVAGVSAKDGSILWQTTEWTVNTATVPSPVPTSDGRVFLSGGYNAGCMMLQLQPQGGKFNAQVAWKLAPTVFGSDQQTPILYNGLIYGVIPGGMLACLDLNGKVKWTSGSQARFGMGPFLIANGLIYLMNDTGTLTLGEVSPSGYKQLGQVQALASATDSWGPMALAGGRLIARDLTRMVCLDVTGP